MIVIDTSALIASLAGGQSSAASLRGFIDAGERIVLPTLALYEWLRGPRREAELELQEVLFPSGDTVEFGPDEARAAAILYRSLPRPRGREIDL
ncbi:MAG: type II toxin-antitoxin system VapC family toxin, partial [Thermoanaerobaculia bacterium]